MRNDFMAPSTIDDFFDSFGGLSLMPSLNMFNGMMASTPTDIKETDDAFIVDMNVPGFKKDEIDVNVKNDVLTISSTKEEKKEDKSKDKYIVKERRVSSFSRSFAIPESAKVDEIKATMNDGILNIVIPKDKEHITSNNKIAIE